MTVLVGVRCTDGVVVGADSAATSAAGNMHLLKLAADKIVLVGGRVIVAGTGQIGLGQRFAEVVKQAHDQKVFQNSTVEVAKVLSAGATKDFGSTGASKGIRPNRQTAR
jgi:20S proteasome alpha/beta subunit